MRVLLNGRELAGLDDGLQRRLAGGLRGGPLDSTALSPDGSVAARAGQLRLLLGGTWFFSVGSILVPSGVRYVTCAACTCRRSPSSSVT